MRAEAKIAVRDRRLEPVAAKVQAGERLEAGDALALYESADLLGLGALADFANRRTNGERVFFAANQHINPTNVCILRNTCVFCSFARMPKEDGAYTRTLEEVYAEAASAVGNPTREFHIVGGLHPKLPLSYYTDMIRGLKDRHPHVHVKALTAVEIANLARVEKTSYADVLQRDSIAITLPSGATVGDVLARVRALPGGGVLPPSPLVALNQQYARSDAVLSPGDEVAIIPPVAGG